MSQSFGFNQDDDIISGDVDYYRGEEDSKDRIALCWFFKDEDGNYQMGPDNTPRFHAQKCYYLEGMGYVEANDYLTDKKGAPKTRIGTLVIEYETNSRGEPKDPLSMEVKPWAFADEEKYHDLKDIHKEFPLTQHDIQVKCSNEKYQHLSFVPKGEPLWQQNEQVREKMLQRVEEVSTEVESGLARTDVSLEDLKEYFGDLEEPAPDESGTDVDYGEIVNDIQVEDS